MPLKAAVSAFLFLSVFRLNTCLYRKHHFVNFDYTFSDAQGHCSANYDGLSIVSNEELQTLSDNPEITSDFYWIGLKRDPVNPFMWRWTGGEEATDIMWDRNEPGTKQCGSVKKSSAMIHDIDCVDEKPFYCMEDFELILVQQESTWEEALEYCRQNYTDLAVLNSDVIMREANNISPQAMTDDVWIGLRFLAGHWFWANSENVEYEAWFSGGEPQCPAMNQHCGVYDRENTVWKPANCEQRLNFLCFKKKNN